MCVYMLTYMKHWNTEPLSLEPFVQHHQDQCDRQPSATLMAPQALGVHSQLCWYPQTHEHTCSHRLWYNTYVLLHSGLMSSWLALGECLCPIQAANSWLMTYQDMQTCCTHPYTMWYWSYKCTNTVQHLHTSVFNEPSVHFEMCQLHCDITLDSGKL